MAEMLTINAATSKVMQRHPPRRGGRPSKRSAVYTFRLSHPLKNKLEKIGHQDGKQLCEVIRLACEIYVSGRALS
jgi:hypothetical protein